MIDAQGIQDHEIPKCLKGKLEFGNTKQIEALKKLEKLIERKKQLKKYEVKIHVTIDEDFVVDVKAINEEEAIEFANDYIDLDELVFDTEIISVEEL